MDDQGSMTGWYVLNAMGIYPYSPADPKYIVSVPIFDKIEMELDDKTTFTIQKQNSGNKITNLTYDGKKLNGYFISHDDLKKGKTLVITTN
jgi:putative alpha-1,2-mannosidase